MNRPPRDQATVPITLFHQYQVAMAVCACGRHFEGRGDKGVAAMEKAMAEHQAECDVDVDDVLGLLSWP